MSTLCSSSLPSIAPSSSLPQVRSLLRQYGWNTISCQLLNPGIKHWLSPTGYGVVGYAQVGRTWVVAGAPVCPPEHLAATTAAFMQAATQRRRHVAFFGAQDRLVAVGMPQGLHARLLLGSQPVWNPHSWPTIVAHKASLRAQLARARHKGVTIAPFPADLALRTPALRRCLAEWLATRRLPPLQFVVAPDVLAAPNDHQVWVAQRAGTVVAYLVATPIPQRNGWLIEQIVRGRAAPNGTAELLIDAAMRALAADGATYVTLGLAPLATHSSEAALSDPLLARTLLTLMRAYGRRFYNFAGLDAFKSKLQPEYWEPVYLLSAERSTSLRTLYAITGAFAGVSPPRFLVHALSRALAQELAWAKGRMQNARASQKP